MFNPGIFHILFRSNERAHFPEALDYPMDDPRHAPWQGLCRQGQVVEAVKYLRGMGLDLPQAVDMANAFRKREGLMPAKRRNWKLAAGIGVAVLMLGLLAAQAVRAGGPGEDRRAWLEIPGQEGGGMKLAVDETGGRTGTFYLRDNHADEYWSIDCQSGVMTWLDGEREEEPLRVDFDGASAGHVFIRGAVCAHE